MKQHPPGLEQLVQDPEKIALFLSYALNTTEGANISAEFTQKTNFWILDENTHDMIAACIQRHNSD